MNLLRLNKQDSDYESWWWRDFFEELIVDEFISCFYVPQMFIKNSTTGLQHKPVQSNLYFQTLLHQKKIVIPPSQVIMSTEIF